MVRAFLVSMDEKKTASLRLVTPTGGMQKGPAELLRKGLAGGGLRLIGYLAAQIEKRWMAP